MSGIRWRPSLVSRLFPIKQKPKEKRKKKESLDADKDHTALGRIGRDVYVGWGSDWESIELIPEVIGKDYDLPYSESISDNVDDGEDDDGDHSADEFVGHLADLREKCRVLWVQELRYAMPPILSYGTISTVTFDQLTVKDRVQCWLENYTGTEWIWHPWNPPRRRAPLGKDCIQWTCVSCLLTETESPN
jgi:hypothetical protein